MDVVIKIEGGVSWQLVCFTLLLATAVLDLVVYRARKGKLPGPQWPVPFVGGVVEMVVAPVPFWQRQIDYCKNGISINSLAGKYMAFITNSKIAQKVYANTDDFILFAHPNAKYLFGEENLIYMDADIHKKIRALLIPGVYGKEALETYLKCQERVIRKHMDAVAASGQEVEARLVFRLMNADASQEAFVGPYLTAEEKPWLAEEILKFTMGFLSVPIPFPGGGLWRAIRARKRIRSLLNEKTVLAEEYIRGGGAPRCVVDFWLQEIAAKGAYALVSHDDVATTILDFMFASQDATTSAVAWALDALTRMPEIKQRLADEVATVAAANAKKGADVAQGAGASECSLHEYFGDLKFLQNCALEILRYRPPVPMVPHLAKRRVELAPGVMVPKGAMVVPSVRGAAYNEEKYDVFDPDNLVDPNFNKVFVFGGGQHKCPGRMYASQLLGVFLAVAVSGYSWERRLTEKSGNTIYAPTLFPEDNLYTFRKL